MTGLSLRRAGATVIFWAAATKIVGFAREVVIAASYGTSQTVDVYLAAITMPALVGTVLRYAFPNAFVPLFAGGQSLAGQTRRHAIRLVAAMGMLTIGFWVFADPISRLTASGFSPEAQAQTVFLLRIVAVAIMLFTVEGLTRSRLEAQKRFAQAGIGPIWSSAIFILAIMLFPNGREQTLIWAFVVGIAVMAVWNILPDRHGGRGLVFKSATVPADSVSGVGRWITIVLLISAIGMFYTVIDRYYASFLAGGSIAALQYANLLASQWVAICGGGLATAILPYLSGKVAERDWTGVSDIVDRAIRWSLIGTIPVAVAMILLSEQVVTVIFERGAFDHQSTVITARLLIVYGAWMLPGVLSLVIGKLYYAMRSWRPVLTATIIALIVKIGLSYWWVHAFGVTGLPGATAVSFGVYATIVFVVLPRWCLTGLWRRWIRYLVVLTVIFVVACLIGRGVSSWFVALPSKAGAYLALGSAGAIGVSILLLLGRRLGFVEIEGLTGRAKSLLRGR